MEINVISPDIEWAMLVAYNQGKMEEAKGTTLYVRYAKIAEEYDVIVGSIANDRMFLCFGQFLSWQHHR